MNARLWMATIAGGWLASVVNAQVVNSEFFNRGGVALYNPEIGLVASGPAVIAHPVVSADRKYVTIGTMPQLTQVVRIETFPVARFGIGGFVGAVRPADVARSSGAASIRKASPSVRSHTGNGQPVLNQSGMTWIAPP